MGNTGVSNAKRIDYFDLAKGLCIFLVVFHHYCSYSYVSEPLAFRCFFKAFRLPLYFFLSGVFFKRYGGLLDFIKRKCNKLLIPFAFWFFLDVLLGKFCKISLSSGVIWFLLCLFEVNIFFYVISLVSERFGKHKTKMLIIMTMLCGCIGIALNFLSVKLPLYIDSAFTALPFFVFGNIINRNTEILQPQKWDKLLPLIVLVMFCIVFLIKPDSYSLRANRFNVKSAIFMYPSGMIGALAVVLLAKWIKRIPVVVTWGRYSIMILVTHMGLFKLLGFLLGCFNIQITSASTLLVLSLIFAFALYFLLIPFMKKFMPHVTAQKDVIPV